MKDKMSYGTFILRALSIRFTDDQADFLWEMFAEYEPEPTSTEEKKYVCPFQPCEAHPEVSQEKYLEDECCHSCSIGSKCEKQDGQHTFIDQAIEDWRNLIDDKTTFWFESAAGNLTIETFLREKLEEQARNERIRCSSHVEVIKEATEKGRQAREAEIVGIIEGMKYSYGCGGTSSSCGAITTNEALEDILNAIRTKE